MRLGQALSKIWRLAGSGCVLTGVACSSEPRGSVVHELANQVMEPTYANFATEAQALTSAVHELCAALDETHLSRAQDAWRSARRPWRLSEPYHFGPSETLRSTSQLDFWPVRTDTIETAIQGAPAPITSAYLASQGAPAKGLPALEYLLFQASQGGATVLESLGQPTSAGGRRCDYASALADQIHAGAAALADAWSSRGGNYVRALGDPDHDRRAFATRQAALNQVVNSSVLALEALTDHRLAAPLGIKAGGIPEPEASESRFSDNAIQDLNDIYAGLRSMYRGRANARGVGHLVSRRSPELHERVQMAFDDAVTKLAAIPLPLRTAVVEDRASVEAAFESARALRRLMAVDVHSLLGVNSTFTFNDGD
jgi:uncharacterized protein